MMNAFGRFTILTTIATYFLIFMGGLVRVSGAGLGCPDWPRCFGRWIPPLSIQQLPPDIDPATFNLTLAWIEYINRFFGVTVGILILIVAIWALARYRSEMRILIPAILAAILTAFQGWQGSHVVLSGLEPVIVSAHMVIALIIAGLMIYLSVQTYYRDRREKGEYANGARLFAHLTIITALVQIIIGTQLRERVETIFAEFPLISSTKVIFETGWLVHFHAFLGLIVVVFAIITAHRLISRSPSSLIWQSGWTMVGLAILQLIFGAILFLAGIPSIARLLHMWTSTMLFGAVLIAYIALGRERRIA
jgi:cytochrome c oxidase assembly protein subunit 15